MSISSIKKEYIVIALIGLCLAGALYMLQGRSGLGLALSDEGFLWYGVQRTLSGDSPTIDFQSYDPGRYYWSAPFLALFGNSVASLRLSYAALQFIGLLCGLMVLRRVMRPPWALALSGALIIVWMVPIWKSYDHAAMLISLLLAVRLLERPDSMRFAAWGAFLSLTALIGRNHLLYNTVAFSLITSYLLLTSKHRRRIAVSSLYTPLVIAAITVACFALRPQQFTQFVGDYYAYIKAGTFKSELFRRDMALPVPWPWKVDYRAMSNLWKAHGLAVGSLFILLPALYIGIGWRILRSISKERAGVSPVLVAAFCVGAPYMHNAFSRADLQHIAQSIHPFLIGSLCLLALARKPKDRALGAVWVSAVIALSLSTTPLYNPFTTKMLIPEAEYKTILINGEPVDVALPTAQAIENITGYLSGRLGPGQKVFIAPHWPTLYAVLNQKAPLWKTHFLTCDAMSQQQEMLQQLREQDIPFVVLGDTALDGREDLRFRNTDRLLWLYIMENYIPVDSVSLPYSYRMYSYSPAGGGIASNKLE